MKKESILSVGIDIGTSTTQVIFSRIYIQNTASAWSVPIVKIIDKEIIYKSKVYFTPLLDKETIDIRRIKEIIEEIYSDAKISPKAVETGAVIITGETARKENAAYVLDFFSEFAGEFVVATAGPELEGILAGKGAGAFRYSKTHNCSVLNLDVGGGTTNIALYQNGQVVDTACFDIGGRLIKFGRRNDVTYISKKAKQLIKLIDINIVEGQPASLSELEKLTDSMASVIGNVLEGNLGGEIHDLLVTDHSLKKVEHIDCICFSGGVARCMGMVKEVYKYGDIGVLLAKSIEKVIKNGSKRLIKPDETIRATVIGAGVHTTDISGSTIHYDLEVLPLKNVPIVRLNPKEEEEIGSKRVEAISKKIRIFLEQEKGLVALSIRGSKQYSFEMIQQLALDIVEGMKEATKNGQPLILVVDQDNAQILGLSLKKQGCKSVVCIDSVNVKDGDYIDIGYPVVGTHVLPVIVKTLLL